MTQLVFKLCTHIWIVQTNPEWVCRIGRDASSCTVRVECDVGSSINVQTQTVYAIKEELKLACTLADRVPNSARLEVESTRLATIRCEGVPDGQEPDSRPN